MLLLAFLSLLSAVATALSSGPTVYTPRLLGEETPCQQNKPLMAPAMALTAHQRRKHAMVVLSTETAGGMGLTNQHSTLLSLLTLGLAANVDKIVLLNHLHRSNFSMSTTWHEGTTEALWDVESIRELLRSRGIDIHVRSSSNIFFY